jgi:hypothetical protein
MNYDKQVSPKRQRQSLKDWWSALAVMWQNFFVALVLLIVACICYSVYLATGDAILYVGGGIVGFVFLWAIVAMVRDF